MDAPQTADVVARFLALFACVDGRPLDALLARDRAGRWVLPAAADLPAELADAARELRNRFHACMILSCTVEACAPAVTVAGDRFCVDIGCMRALLTRRFTGLSASALQRIADNGTRIEQMLAHPSGPSLLAALLFSAKEDARFNGRPLFHRLLVGIFDP